MDNCLSYFRHKNLLTFSFPLSHLPSSLPSLSLSFFLSIGAHSHTFSLVSTERIPQKGWFQLRQTDAVRPFHGLHKDCDSHCSPFRNPEYS